MKIPDSVCNTVEQKVIISESQSMHCVCLKTIKGRPIMSGSGPLIDGSLIDKGNQS